MNMKIITIKSYEIRSRSRWGWHTFRDGKDYKGKIIGFRFLGIGLCWAKREMKPTNPKLEALEKILREPNDKYTIEVQRNGSIRAVENKPYIQ